MISLFADYRDWYQLHIISTIEDTDIRRVAELLNHHYGKENRVEIEPACIALWGEFNEDTTGRKFRKIAEILTVEYHFPVGSTAGAAGYWRCKPEEIEKVKEGLRNRIEHTQARLEAYDQAIFPPEEPVIPAPAVYEKAEQLAFL